jgi:membrane protein
VKAKVIWWTVAKEAAENWSSHRDSRQGAALAYYSVFSLGPIIVIAIAVAGFFFGREAVSGQVASSIRDMLGDTGAKAVEAMLADAGRPREGIVATLLGVAAVVFAAIGVVVQLKDALNTVWEVEETPGHGAWQFIRNYVISLAAVLALGFLLMVSLLVTAGLAAFGKYAAPHMQEWLLHLITMLASVGVTSLLFAMMFKWLPDVAVDWYDVWFGAVTPLDILVIHDAGTYPGLVLRRRPIGILEVLQVTKGENERNDRSFAVPDRSPFEGDLQDVRRLPARAVDELEKFFEATDALEDKKLKFLGWHRPTRDQGHQETFAVGIAHIADWIFKYFRKAPISIGAFLFGLLTVFDDGLAAVPSSFSFLITVVRSAGSRSLMTVVRSRSRLRS